MNTELLLKNGFSEDAELKAAVEASAEKNNLHHNGAFTCLGVFKKGLVTLVFEQNNATEDLGNGLKAMVSHPAVCIVSSPKGTVACNADDDELILTVADDLA